MRKVHYVHNGRVVCKTKPKVGIGTELLTTTSEPDTTCIMCNLWFNRGRQSYEEFIEPKYKRKARSDESSGG